MNNEIILIGMSRVGKSSVGKRLAEKRKIPFFDTDTLLEKKYLKPIKEIYKEFGEARFREFEYEVFSDILKHNQKKIIATGGGIVENSKNLCLLKQNKNVVFLNADCDFIFTRILSEIDKRQESPSFLSPAGITEIDTIKSNLQELYKSRLPLYKSVANTIITVDDKTIEMICSEILY
ncbi:MAG: shikimate kinase [Treponema sp.]|nr:MAG: shikimate kinase [Treponema sp.]